jgi:tRNA nucleotidyltransferase (CCA-adding enzyme)
LLEVLAALRRAGREAVVVGGCLRDLCLGRPVLDWDVATSAPPEAVLALFPRAVPIGLRHGTVMVPSPAGPIDVTTFRAGPTLAADLALRDFTIDAIAFDPEPPCWIDPEGGLDDLRALRLRAVGEPRARLAEDPLRVLRAVRLVAELGVSVDPSLAAALRDAAPRLREVSAERVRSELERLLLGRWVASALRLARDGGVDAALGAGVAADAPALLEALPRDLTLRLAGWLRGSDAARLLAKLRFPSARVEAVSRLVRAHPLDPVPRSAVELARLLSRLGREAVEGLVTLREAELAVEGGAQEPRPEADARRERLQEIRRRIAALAEAGILGPRGPRLAVGGAQVMGWLGCGPGPRVGRALRYLTEQVLEDPSRNHPDTLRNLLLAAKCE